MLFTIQQIQAMAKECANQKSGELSVARLAQAVAYVKGNADMDSRLLLSEELIQHLGILIEPSVNVYGFRKTPVKIDGKIAGVPAGQISSSLAQLCKAWNEQRISREEIYEYFELCHPFKDGNGRVGFILFNLENIINDRDFDAAPEFAKR